MTKSGTGSMLINIVLLVMGLVVVLKGADWLTDGAVNIASRFGVSQMVIGLTIVAMGTSMPELCVSMVSALKGTPDLAVGNVVGSPRQGDTAACGGLSMPHLRLKPVCRQRLVYSFHPRRVRCRDRSYHRGGRHLASRIGYQHGVGQEGQQRHCHWQRHWLKRL